MKLIDKDAALAKIERLKAEALQKKSQCKRHGLEKIIHQIGAYNKVLSLIDTLEVKEVDLDTDFGVCWGEYCDYGGNINDYKVAKHFFELGLHCSQTDDSYIEGVKGSYTTTDKD